jgi:hypothetical protein
MLFAHMSLWAIALTLVVLFVLKFYGVGWILKTNYATQYTANRGWVASININVAVNAVLTFILLFLFISPFWAAVLALVDALVTYCLGYYRHRHHVPSVNAQTLLNVYNVATFLHTNAYVGIVYFIIHYLYPSAAVALPALK